MSYAPVRSIFASFVAAIVASVFLFCGAAWADIVVGETALGSDSLSLLSRIIDSVSSGGSCIISPLGKSVSRGEGGTNIIDKDASNERTVTTSGNNDVPEVEGVSAAQSRKAPLAAASASEEANYIEVSTYEELARAVGGTTDTTVNVRIMQDMDITDFLGGINNGYNTTIDFNGKTVNYVSNTAIEAMAQPFISVGSNGVLTLIGGNGGKLTATNEAAVAAYGSGILNIIGLQIVNADHIGIYGDGEDAQINLDGATVRAKQAIVSVSDVVVSNSTITSTGDDAYGIDGYGAVELNGGSVTGKAGGINVRWDATINGGSVTGENGAPAIVVTTEQGEETPTTAINGGIFSTNPTGLDGVTIADGNVISQVTSGTNTGKFRVTPTDTTADGWDLSAVSGTVTANGNRFPASDATISYVWGDGTNDKVTLNQTAEGSTEDGFYISWTKNNDNGGVSAQGLLFAASADDRPQDAGSYTGTIHGTGAYSGLSGTTQLTLERKSIKTSGLDYERTQPYTGLPVEPEVTVTHPTELGQYLRPGVDYEVTYLNNINPGTATIQVRGVGGYCDTVTGSFTILQPTEADEPGKWGTCPWELSDDGTLTVHAGAGRSTGGASPWGDVADRVKRVVFEPGVVAPANCSSLLRDFTELESVDLSGLDMSSAICIDNMFWNCKKLSSIDLSWRGEPRLVSMRYAFGNCSKLERLGFGSIDTSRVTDMFYLFNGCVLLESLDLGKLDTSSVVDMQGMFNSCRSLGSLDLSGFDTSKVQSFGSMFRYCRSLATITVSSKWSTAAAASEESNTDVFANCRSLVGGAGTVFDSSRVSLAMAHVDAAGNPGYLTLAKQDPAPSPSPTPSPSPSPSPVKTQTMYRLYNKWSGEHLFTLSKAEYDSLGRIGWKQEGEAWKSPTSGTKVYRLYNRFSGDHHYTTSASEYATLGRIGWTQEGVGFYSGGTRKVYRGFNPYESIGTHHYTIDRGEINAMVRNGWRDEGVGWYCY